MNHKIVVQVNLGFDLKKAAKISTRSIDGTINHQINPQGFELEILSANIIESEFMDEENGILNYWNTEDRNQVFKDTMKEAAITVLADFKKNTQQIDNKK